MKAINTQPQRYQLEQFEVAHGYSRREQFREEIIRWLTNPTNKYHLTVTFRPGLSNNLYHQKFEHLIHKLNQALYSRRYRIKQPIRYLYGFAMRELNSNGEVHFHCLIQDPHGDLESKNDLQSALDKVVPKITYGRKSYDVSTKKWKGRRLIVEKDGPLLQSYYNDGSSRLEEYVTKQFDDWRFSVDECLGCVGLLGRDGVNFGGIYIK